MKHATDTIRLVTAILGIALGGTAIVASADSPCAPAPPPPIDAGWGFGAPEQKALWESNAAILKASIHDDLAASHHVIRVDLPFTPVLQPEGPGGRARR